MLMLKQTESTTVHLARLLSGLESHVSTSRQLSQVNAGVMCVHPATRIMGRNEPLL
jgi:hypothetical protein